MLHRARGTMIKNKHCSTRYVPPALNILKFFKLDFFHNNGFDFETEINMYRVWVWRLGYCVRR